MKKHKTKGGIIGTVSTVLVVIVVLLAILLAGGRLLGLKIYTVLSPSMEPTYRVGSVIYVKPVDPITVEEGQAITFYMDGSTVATHRVVEIERGDNGSVLFRTKGDANSTIDGIPVEGASVIGIPVFTIPYLGYIANYIQHPPGLYITLAVIAILLLMIFLPDAFRDGKKEQKGNSTEKGGNGDKDADDKP